ncbi:hypothetical protein DYD21_20340 [Rhodohalobacter sp. SW132]|uniref:hypothetical protein n=1 Tax=Rhodohalobacter sp. SW132 TaxID=2293433 RepID=UPI000E276F20|nr:hypothetical protein [Rhodohalobacter sp. SW132]REL23990.1 hypothetical protein DYD21_20340 [Rhodohalobacter sp. SW132]
MNFKQLRRSVAPWIKNIGGWSTQKKLLVIESDDWGSIRMPSREVYETCLKAGYRVDQIAYERYDSLASETDLELLFDLLLSFKDSRGRHPVITANVLPANPDFDKIRESEFREYHYESVRDTLARYPEHGRCFKLWTDGLDQNIFFPQSHGREHLNVSLFMNALHKEDKDMRFAFKHGLPGSIPHGSNPAGGNKYVESLRYSDPEDKQHKLEIILEGLDLFEELFGYRSETFIPPNYLWSPDFNPAVSDKGVRYLQGKSKMKEPLHDGTVTYHSRKPGDRTAEGQYCLVRNAVFEPSLFKMNTGNPVDQCLNDISAAFTHRKPAVICSHRINYVGYIDPENRDRNLIMLRELITAVQKRWPETEFITSAELGKRIEKDT